MNIELRTNGLFVSWHVVFMYFTNIITFPQRNSGVFIALETAFFFFFIILPTRAAARVSYFPSTLDSRVRSDGDAR